MAITFAKVEEFHQGSDGNPYAGASKTWASGKLYLAAVWAARSGSDPTATPTVSGGPAWTQVANKLWSGSARRLYIYRAVGAGENAAFSVDNGAETWLAAAWIIMEVTGVDTTTNQGVVQSISTNGAGVTATSLTLAAAPGSSANAILCAVSHNTAETTTVDASFSALSPTGSSEEITGTGGQNVGLLAQVKTTSQQTFGASWATSGNHSAIGVEIKATAETPGTAGTVIKVWRDGAWVGLTP